MKNIANIDDIEIGMSAHTVRFITDDDMRAFAAVSGDYNPVHLDEEFATSSRYGRRIAHGLMCASSFSALFGTELPGTGCVYLSQSLNFKRPVYIGDEVIATVRVDALDRAKDRVTFSTTCTVKGRIVIDGIAEIYIPREKKRDK